jgi:GR25 family glycosyltransferase involved in LPS biosynthesis
MAELTGGSFAGFLVITVLVLGFAAYMTGYAMAQTWKPAWHAVAYALLLGGADRFLAYALFEGELLSPLGYLLDTAVLVAIALFAYRLTRAERMVNQYPWLYERAGLFHWRDRPASEADLSP